jgi:hypothetical protein
MKKHTIALIARSLLVLLLFTCGIAAAGETPQLEKLKYTAVSPGAEEVTLQFNGSYSPKIFTLKGESPRVILDFADMTHSRAIKTVTATDGAIIKRVRVGMHADGSPKTRVVFDLATLKDVDYTQSFDEKTSTLTLRFTGPAKAAEPAKTPAPRKQQDKPTAKAAAAAPQTATTKSVTKEKAAESATASVAAPEVPKPAPATADLQQPAPDKAAQDAAVAVTEKPAQQPAATPVQAPEKAALPPQPVQAEKQPAAVEKKAETQPPAKPVPAPAQEKTPAVAKPDEQSVPAPTAETAKKDKPAETQPAVAEAKPEEKKVEKTAKAQAAEPGKGDAKTENAKTETPADAAKSEEGPQLEYVKFDPNSPKGEMVLFKLNGFHPPAVHGVEEGIPRVVCDFNNTKLLDAGKGTIKANGKFVKMIRTTKTKKPEKVRVVIDLEPNRSYDLQQVFFKEDNLFVIIVNTVKK